MLPLNRSLVYRNRHLPAILAAFLSLIFLTVVFDIPAHSRMVASGQVRENASMKTHIGRLFQTFTADIEIGEPKKVGKGDVWPVFRDGKLLGYVFLTVEFAPLPAYSGRPFEALVAIDSKGKYLGVKILFHEEPIFLGGYGVEPPEKVTKQYRGLKVQDTIKVRGAGEDVRTTEGYAFIDGISRATISVEVLNQSIVQSAVEVARKVVEGFTRSQTATVNLDISENVTWDSLQKKDWLARNNFNYGEVYKSFEGTSQEFGNTEQTAAANEMFADIYVAQVNVPTIGNYLLGQAGLERLLENELKPGENAILVLSNGPYSILADDFVPSSSSRRLSIQQAERSIEIQDVNFYRFLKPNWPKDMPQFKQARIFKVSAYEAFDPSLPWKLNLNVIRGTQRLSTTVTKAFPTNYRLPDRFFVAPDTNGSSGPLWLELWTKRWIEIVLLIAGLGLLTAIAVRPTLVVKDAKQFRIFRWVFLLYTVGFVGYFTQAQLSVTHVLTLVGMLFDASAASGLLLDPIICILGIYVLVTLVIWGRGFFCGWLCPFGAMQEMMAAIGERLRLPQPKIPWAVHSFGNKIKYFVFLGLVVASFFSVATAEVLAEVEPFKTAITLNFIRSWPFVVYAVALLLASMFIHKFFCRYLCPLGAGLAILGKLRVIDSIQRREACGSPCQLCSVKCGIKAIKPTGAIDYDECIQCYDCVVIHDDKTQCVPMVLAEKKKSRQGIHAGQLVADPLKPSISMPVGTAPKPSTRPRPVATIGRAAAGIAMVVTLGAGYFSSDEQDEPLMVRLGTPASTEAIAQADLSITPDGDNLPAGSGTHAQGQIVFDTKCASCHGVYGAGIEGGLEPLVGGIGTLNTDAPVKTVGSFWPYSTTLFDYVRRSMPLDAPMTLTDEEVYALCAYLLAENGIIDKTAVMTAETLPKVQMPNRAGFVSQWEGHQHE